MLYYLAKIAQATGLAVILVGFIGHFPALMNMRMFWTGTAVFFFGWIIQRFALKSK
ncbi:MAG: hypothetical protein HZA28_06050 [Candidatus Omnitrophica bacterium]|nr:hypothetical protein [Candidatus Omnitrophota bacterium]